MSKRHRYPRELQMEFQRIGKESEERFLRIFEERYYHYRLPLWLKRVVRASKQDDAQGVDFYAVTTDRLYIPIDIKSSGRALGRTIGGRHKKDPHRPQAVFIIVHRHQSDDDVYADTTKKLLKRRGILLAARGAGS